MRVQFRITGFIAAFVQLTDQVCHCNRTTELFRVNQTKYNQSMNQCMQTYLFISTAEFCSEADQKTYNVHMTHVCCPVHRTTILLVKCVNCCTFLQQQLRYLHTIRYSCRSLYYSAIPLMICRNYFKNGPKNYY